MKQPLTERIRAWYHTHIKIPFGVKVAVCVFPALLLVLYYLLRPMRGVMDWFSVYAALPVRHFFGMLSSVYPISLMEILCTAAGIFLLYYIIKALRDSARKRDKWKLLGRRVLGLLVVTCYIFAAFNWLWNSGYHATGFAQRYNFPDRSIETSELVAVTAFFAEKANELSVELERDDDGNLIANRSVMLTESKYIYKNIAQQFPSLRGTLYAPKPMYIYSWLMTITGYSGMYFALTGEAMINIQLHPAYMPMTVAHEHAHQLGVFAEDEANFVGILACVTSGNPVFEYAGYLSGLGYLSNALYRADSEQYTRIMSSLSPQVMLDRAQNAEFWANSATSDTGIEFVDNIFTAIMNASNTAVDTVYDGYLRSQSQPLGILSYGACVELLVIYFSTVPG